MIYKLSNGTKKQLSTHFNAYEFRCRCGGNHYIYIDSELIDFLEKLRAELKADACVVYSGYRCSSHDKKVGGSGGGPHTKSDSSAVDCYFTRNKSRIPGQEVCLKIEDLGWNYGVGYRCGGGSNASGQMHIDNRKRKWYGNEAISMSKSCCSSWYSYFGIKKPEKEDIIIQPVERDESKNQLKVLATNLRVRRDPSTKSEVRGFVKTGKIYNYLSTKENEGYIWYQIDDIQWIANVNLEIYPKKEEEDPAMIEQLKKELEENKKLLEQKENELKTKDEDMKNYINSFKNLFKCPKSGFYKIYLKENENLYIK